MANEVRAPSTGNGVPSQPTVIPVFSGVIQGLPAQLVDARSLHLYLAVGKRFASWITERIADYGFDQGLDFLKVRSLSVPNSGSSKARPQRRIDYHLTLDMAKELSMVERNEKGREARRYFIAVERHALAQQALNSASEREALKLLTATRFLCSFDFEGKLHLHEVSSNAIVMPPERLAHYIRDPEGAPRATLYDILDAVGRRMKRYVENT